MKTITLIALGLLSFSSSSWAKLSRINLETRFVVRVANLDSSCSGLLISPTLVLTANHCPSNGRVILNAESDLEPAVKGPFVATDIESVFLTRDFNGSHEFGDSPDLKVLRLKEPLVKSSKAFSAIEFHTHKKFDEMTLRSAALTELWNWPSLRDCAVVSSSDSSIILLEADCPSRVGFSGGALYQIVEQNNELKLQVFAVASHVTRINRGGITYISPTTYFSLITAFSLEQVSKLKENGIKFVSHE